MGRVWGFCIQGVALLALWHAFAAACSQLCGDQRRAWWLLMVMMPHVELVMQKRRAGVVERVGRGKDSWRSGTGRSPTLLIRTVTTTFLRFNWTLRTTNPTNSPQVVAAAWVCSICEYGHGLKPLALLLSIRMTLCFFAVRRRRVLVLGSGDERRSSLQLPCGAVANLQCSHPPSLFGLYTTSLFLPLPKMYMVSF